MTARETKSLKYESKDNGFSHRDHRSKKGRKAYKRHINKGFRIKKQKLKEDELDNLMKNYE